MTQPPAFTCDIFCRVVDNFGDIGVCWRLARQLHAEFGIASRLIVDDLASFQKIAPALNLTLAQQFFQGIEIIVWKKAPTLLPSDCVIEAFGCELPRDYLAAMAKQATAPVWLNLEYLSAESWVGEHHLMPSPHPRLPLTKTFFFPGFTPKTGGILREKNRPNPAPVLAFDDNSPLHIYVLGYPNVALPTLLNAFSSSEKKYECTFAESALGSAALAHQPSAHVKIQTHPFVPQENFDALIADHDICFVRGEDSFVRAQLAAKPFIWQIYPQAENAHLAKLEAFLALYCNGLAANAANALHALSMAWNEQDWARIAQAWDDFYANLPMLQQHAQNWAAKLTQQPDLASNLVEFVMTSQQKVAKI